MQQTIRFYNTLTHRVEDFETIEPGVVRMYHCGPTVYDFAHIGNFRAFLMADLLRRFFEFTGRRVVQVMNLTDVGHMTEDTQADGGGRDKMEVAAERLKQAKKQGTANVENPDDPYQVAGYFTKAFLEDAKLLRMKLVDEYPSHMPSATGNIDNMIGMIGTLIRGGHAYVAGEPGSRAVYYDVRSFPRYGQLSGNTLEALQTGAGGRVDETKTSGKRDPNDFLLWKEDGKHLMRWPSPWGEGYPGWHIECSAMAIAVHTALAGRAIPSLDIHTGGEDNIFPHHECEIAQSNGATGQEFSRYWMHVRHLMVEGQKMSKSKGNFFTVRDILSKGVPPEVLRFELMRTHYRSNANFTFKGLEDSAKMVERIRAAAGSAKPQAADGKMGDTALERDFAAALAEDLNISEALGVLFKFLNATPEVGGADAAALRRIDAVLGVCEPSTAAPSAAGGPSDAEIESKAQEITAARSRRDYATSDRLRDELMAAGVEVMISKDGVKWKRKMRLG